MLLSCCRYYPVKNCHKELIKTNTDCGLKYLKNWIIYYSNFDKNVNGDSWIDIFCIIWVLFGTYGNISTVVLWIGLTNCFWTVWCCIQLLKIY